MYNNSRMDSWLRDRPVTFLLPDNIGNRFVVSREITQSVEYVVGVDAGGSR